jgi:membrane-anchored protein YejM (alkaline phosphatase superfamily)
VPGLRSRGARGRLVRWANGFALANVTLLAVVGLRYLWYYSPLTPWVGWSYAALAFVGHLAALAYLPLLLLLPVMLLLPRPGLVLSLAACLESMLLGFLLLDSMVFAENRYHLGILTLSMLAPLTWAFLAFYVLLALAVEAMVALWIWRRTAQGRPRRWGWLVALGLGACLLASNVIHALSEANYYAPVTAFTRYLPLYQPRSDRGLVKLGLVDRREARERGVTAAPGWSRDGGLNYPLAPLRCAPRPPLHNVLLVVIDGMRADSLTPAVAPSLAGLAQDAVRFDAHWSGGNSSRAGLFSLFYGLPATYFDAFASQTQPPVLMDLFRQHGYQLGLYASAPVYRAVALDRTALARVPNLRLETVTPYPGSAGWDRAVTEEWLDWLDRRDASRPFFGFLYYDAAVAMEPPADHPPVAPVGPESPTEARRFARYLTAVHYVDSLLGRVLDDLRRRRLLDRTVVIVTSDHGVEFDENGLGFTGHGTAFGEPQMRTPMVVRWPGRPPGRIAHRTSHNDLAPTLVGLLFGCANPPSDYSSGHGLFAGVPWEWLIAGGYEDVALIEPERVIVVFPSGYEIRDRHYRLVPRPTLPRDVVRAAMHEMRRFYR